MEGDVTAGTEVVLDGLEELERLREVEEMGTLLRASDDELPRCPSELCEMVSELADVDELINDEPEEPD